MRLVIFGASGFIGQNIVKFFSKQDIDFICLGRKESPFSPSINYTKIDITKLDEVTSVLEDKDAIIHFAASSLLTSLENPIMDMRTNIEGTLNILEAVKDLTVTKIIFASTIALFDRIHYNPVDEKHPCNPKTPYGVSKLAAENYLNVYSQIYGINYLIFRFTNIYGPYQKAGIIPLLINKISRGKEIEIFGDGKAVRDFVFVEDIPGIILKAMKNPTKKGIINFGSGKSTSINDVISIMEKIVQKKAKIIFREQKKGEIKNFTVNIKKLEEQLGGIPTTSLEEGLKHTYNWFQKRQKSSSNL